jgi:heptosyltransferase I
MAAAAAIDLAACRRVLVVKPSSLGDIVHATPAVAALKRAFPAVAFHWVVNQEWQPLLVGNPDLAGVIPFPRRELRGLAAPLGFLRWARAVRCETGGFDATVDFQGLLRAVLIARGLGGGPLAGLADAREGAGWWYHLRVDPGPRPHAVDRYLALAAALGGEVSRPAFFLPPGSRPAPPAPADPGFILHPYSRGAGKSLPDDLIAAVAAALAPHPVTLVGVRAVPAPAWPANVTDLANRTSLPELIWLLRRARATISVDSGPLHLAAALPAALLGLHTWSDPRKVGPWRPDATVWKAGRIAKVAGLDDCDPAWCASPASWDAGLPAAVAAWAAAF